MENSKISPWKRLSDLLKLDKSEVSQLYLYAFFSGIVSLSLPLGIQSVIHFIQGGQITTSWALLVALVILGVVLTGVLQIMQLRITENIQQRIYTRYSFDFAFRFPRLNRMAIKGENPSELMNRFFDVINLQKGISKVLLDLFSAMLQIFFSLIVLSFYHPLYIIFSISLVIVIVLVFRPIIKKGYNTSLKESKFKYKTANWLQEIARSDWSFRLSPKGNHALKTLDVHTTDYLKARENHFKVLWKQYIWMIAIKSVIVAALLGLGGYLVIDQQMNLGQFVAAEVLIILILGAFEKIIQLLETLYDVFTSMEKLGQLTDLPMAYDDELLEIQPDSIFPIEVIEIKNPSIPIIKIESGDKIILTGGTQHEIVKLLRQLIDTTITSEYTPRWNNTIPSPKMIAGAMETIGWYDKTTHLFEGTLRENILMGKDFLSLTELQTALEVVGMTNYVSSHAAGLDILLNNSSKNLTEQERDRLLIARAIVHNPMMLILSFHGLAFKSNELLEILQKIEKTYTNTTIICANPEAIAINWKTLTI